MGAIELSMGAPTDGLDRALQQALEAASREGYAHVILRCDGADWDVTWAAQAAGLRLVDAGVDLRCRALGPVPSSGSHGCRPWAPPDLPALQQIAADSFVFSRFWVDPFFTDSEVRRFHAEWVTNLCHGLADEVLVVGEVGSPVGFVSCTGRGGAPRIPLIAVRASARGQGIGDRLIRAAKDWFAGEAHGVAWVKTQAQNYPALALYTRHGFAPARTEFVFSTQLHAQAGRRGGLQ
jgi:GNAT superfamily N-acetyltransferase